jgi:hypothetical protein
MFKLAGCDEKPGNEANSLQETRQNCPAAVGKGVAVSIYFLLFICIKSRKIVKNYI